jgi:sulfatase modifying factor 1
LKHVLFCATSLALFIFACGKSQEGAPDAGSPAPSVAPAASGTATPSASPSASAALTASTAASASPAGSCPADMAYVDTMFCDKVERDCVDVEHEKPNNLTICHRFREGSTKCLGTEERRRFCIDKYEYPNKEGAHPLWNITWFEAQASCKSRGKRLCWGSEWTAACEGPEHTPFPYGWARDHDACNIDSFFIDPRKGEGGFLFSSKNKDIRHAELSRLDQSVPSGSMPRCKSGFGVHDMTGNFDEWIVSDEPPQHKSRWAGLKGGGWGHVRNQCRPQTYSHEPQEWYYFWSFRCCKDAEGAPVWKPPHGKNMAAPDVEAKDAYTEPIVPINPPGPSKTKYGRNGADGAKKK